jgi:sporulation protein YlmC with PRC-barrel domain
MHMLLKHMAACLVVTALAGPAFAQTAAPPPSGGTDRPAATGTNDPVAGSPSMRPGSTGTNMPGSSSTTMAPGSTTTGNFMTERMPNQMLASKLIGMTVVSANNESIGDVNDVLVDRNGQVQAVVIGVGGFLGIGEKDVAIPFQSVEFTSRTALSDNRPSTTGATNNPSSTTSTSASNANPSAAGTNPSASSATTGSTGTATAGSNASGSGEVDRIVLRMSKADLQNAPAFRTSDTGRNPSGTTGTPSGAQGQPGTNRP